MPAMDTSLPAWTRNKGLRRLLLVALFVAIIAGLRHLLVMLVFFVAFERIIGWPAEQLSRRTKLKRHWSILAVLGALTALLAGASAFGVGSALRAWFSLRTNLPDRIAALRGSRPYQFVQEYFEGAADRILDGAGHYASSALHYATTIGHMIAFALLGLVLAIVYLFEKDELDKFWATIDPRTMIGTLMRWFRHVYDAIAVTLGFQVVVAAVNAVFTWPVLVLIGVPHATALMFMIFFSGMVPVAGNFVAGAILTLLAWQAKGWTGVIVFTILTFILGKIESYYLNPRLARKHVRLPGFVLIVSLVVFEQIFGFVGLLLSFPFLFVAGRIRDDFRKEDGVPPPLAKQDVPSTEPPNEPPAAELPVAPAPLQQEPAS
jgi:predicted PurR-regulated permease PerM